MIINTEEYIRILAKYNITEHEFLILKLLDDEDSDNVDLYKSLIGGFDSSSIKSLEEKNLIIKNEGSFYKINIDLSADTTDSDMLASAIWNAYPSWLLINNEKVSAKSTDVDQFYTFYIKKVIKGSKRKHEKILSIVTQYRNDNGGFATMGIDKFFRSRHYEQLKEVTHVENTSTYGQQSF